MKEDLVRWLNQATRVFFDYLLDCLEGSEYFIDAQSKYYQLYPNAITDDQLTLSPKHQVFNIKGTKHVSVHIENVETLALGDNVKTKIVKGNE